MKQDSYEIDKHRLHAEWERQPKMYHEAADRLAEADGEVDRLKGIMELMAAEVEMEVRENPQGFGMKKATEASVEKAVIMDQRFQRAQSAFLGAKAKARHLRAEVMYLDQRKTALEYLSKLRLADYFADPRISGDEREEGEEQLRKRALSATRNRS
jgi:hypothetical protein